MLCTLETQQSRASGGVGDTGAGAATASATGSEGMCEYVFCFYFGHNTTSLSL